MTREEAIKVLNAVDENASCDDCLYYAQMEDCPTDDDCIIRKAIWMAISALEQEPLKNIREEIASHIGGCGFLNDGLDVALRIIDKHCPSCGAEMVEPQESEDKE